MTDTYIYLIREPDWDSDVAPDHSPGHDAEFLAHRRFQEAVGELGARIVSGQALANARHGGVVTPGKGERTVEDAVYTDSPYADSSELVTGFYAIETDDHDLARRIAAMVPTKGTIEWRKVFQTG